MLMPRIIPCLLIKNGGLVKTFQFGKNKYVGDPLNAVRIFNEKIVDELIVLDIDATVLNKEPDYKLIENLAMECRMPLCYGGGIKNAEQVQRIVGLGVEKVAISSSAISHPEIISQAAGTVGSQSVVIVMDVKKKRLGNKYRIYTHNGTKATNLDAVSFAKSAESAGAGEIVVNSIDRDGMMTGYDDALVTMVRRAIHLPMTVLGGASSLGDIQKLIKEYGVIGAAAGSLFVFKGIYKAVLISYPNQQEKEDLLNEVL